MSDLYYLDTTTGTITITLLTASNTASNTITIPVNTGTYIIPNNTIYPIITNNCITPIGLGGDFVLPTASVATKKKEAGCSCVKCRDFNEYAEANQLDGSFICYACRKGL